REDEARGRRVIPRLKRGGALERVERAVHLQGVEATAGVREFQPLREAVRIEVPAPRRVVPPRDADTDLRHRGLYSPPPGQKLSVTPTRMKWRTSRSPSIAEPGK